MAQERVELHGQLLDSMVLPRILDTILAHGACYLIEQMKVGIMPQDPSHIRIFIEHADPRKLAALLRAIHRHGAMPVERREAALAAVKRDGVLPDGFYATTNLDTQVFVKGRWIKIKNPEMDSAVVVSATRRAARTIKMADVKRGDLIVVGSAGVRVVAPWMQPTAREFEFMSSAVSSEKPKAALIGRVARLMKQTRKARKPILWVCGPAVVHSGAGPLFEALINAGYAQMLFAGNALAAHDIECALMGTALGISLREGEPTVSGHENHLRAINAIRAAGGIEQAVRKGILKSGIMRACVKKKVDFVLAGSIRDDGPLPEVITDTQTAQKEMRKRAREAGMVIMLATLLHSVATGNMLPAHTPVVCADIQQSAITKLMDRGTTHTIGLMTDAQPFLRELCDELGVRAK